MKINEKEKVNIIDEYTYKLTPMITLASKYQVTRQAIYKIIKQAGVDTLKHKILVSCDCCGKEVLKPRCNIRNKKKIFCSMDCYYAYLEAGQPGRYIENRHGQRIAREVVSRHFSLQDTNIVHHKDRNTLFNNPTNLMVFKNNGDHIRYHRGIDITPIWDGEVDIT